MSLTTHMTLSWHSVQLLTVSTRSIDETVGSTQCFELPRVSQWDLKGLEMMRIDGRINSVSAPLPTLLMKNSVHRKICGPTIVDSVLAGCKLP